MCENERLAFRAMESKLTGFEKETKYLPRIQMRAANLEAVGRLVSIDFLVHSRNNHYGALE